MRFLPQDFIGATNKSKIEATYNTFFRNGVMLDSEMLYLLIVGKYDSDNGTNFLKGIKCDTTDHEKLRRFLNALTKFPFYITPHVFAKFIHLLWENVKEKDSYYGITTLFMSNFAFIDERHISQIKVLEMENFRKRYYDLCNASLILTTEIHPHNSVITADGKFARICEERGNVLVVFYPDIKSYIQALPKE